MVLLYVTVALAVVFCCQKGMAQLCVNERMCEVSINVTQSFQQYELNDGIKTCFSCLFNGAIETDTTWFINDSPDIPLTTGANPFGTNNNGVLEICNTTDILDSVADATPRFVCQSLTANANHSLFITLRALNPPSITPLIDPILVNESDPTLELRCLHADSEPITSEEWRGPDGTVVSTQASLILTNLNRDDSGEYTCIITNDMGESLNTSRNITVQHAPLVTTGNDFTQVPLFDMLMLSCDFVAVPVPTSIQWFLNFTQELVSDGSSIMIVSTDTSSTLMITNVMRNSTGNYTCMVSNLLGTGEAISMVRIQIPPAAADGLVVPEVFKTSVELEWTIGFEGFSSVTEVDIEVFLQSDSTRVFPTVSLNGNLQNANITSLTPLTGYIFRVYLINNRISGRSDPAETVGTTLSLPLEVPTNLTCPATSSSTLQCSWQAPPPLATTNPADTWMIEYQEAGFVNPVVDRNTSDNSTTLVLDGLTSFTVYTARVAGINSCGFGTFSEFFNATTLAGPPNSNSAVAPSAFAINISWIPPNTNLVVTGYIISLAEVDSATSEVGQFVELLPQLPASARMLFLWNPTIEPLDNPRIQLTANSTYEVRVAAVHSAGVGEPVSTRVTTPSADVPQPIYTVPVVTDITQSSVVLTWFVPGGVVNSYTVEYCDNATGVCSNTTTADGRPTVTLGGLMPFTMYYVRVATNNNAFGTSQFSPSATFTTLAVAPVVTEMQPDPVSVGAMIELVCVAAEGTPPLTYTWSRDSDGTVVFTSTTSGVYSFTAASDSAGLYTCTITNPLGSDTTSVNVEGIPPTVLPTQSPVVQVVIGANLTLAVDITGFNQPLTAVTWSRGGVELTNDTARVTVINSDLSVAPATSELTVSPVMIPEADGGVYVVSAESPAGTCDVIFFIEVFAPPTITGPQGDMTIDEGAPILLRCTARGFPAPSFTWLQGTTPLTNALPRIAIDGMPFVTYVGGSRVVTSTLEISAAERSDEGSYACVASNNEPDGANGEARSNFTITVNFPPLSTGVSVAITAVLCSVAFFALGVLSTLLVVYCLSSTAKRRAQYSVSSSSTEPQTQAPVYEEISITDTKPKAIELSENIAYGPTRR